MQKLGIAEPNGSSGKYSCICVVVSIVFASIIFLAVGIGVGYAVGKNKFDEKCPAANANGNNAASSEQSIEEQEKTFKSILMEMKAENIRSNLKNLTAFPHPPGKERNKVLGDILMEEWKRHGMDHVENFKYNIYLSYPEAPGEITLHGKDADNKLVIGNEPGFDESEKHNDQIPYPFNAFSGRGTITGELVYGNYGRDSDFDALKELGINVTGKIMIFRYGKTSRTRKVYRTQIRGGLGCIIFSDPYDHTIEGKEYPKGWMLNRDGVQRGTVNWLPGDALSIGYPAKDKYFRKNESEYSGNPEIPSQPISYGTAYEILKFMAMNNDTNNTAPTGFSGALNFTKYPLRSGAGRNVSVNVSTILETKSSYTQCAKLYGKTEPDRYIMFGNHRDGWTYGASDPSSGTAVMMEIVRVLGEHKKKGWRPRRSIMACSWGAEEPGILGSTEWADENHKFLTNNVAAYLNVDMAVEGNFTVRIKTLDYIVDAIFKAAKLIPAPNVSDTTLYDDWHKKSMMLGKTTDETKVPRPTYTTAGSGSDYKALWHTYGTPIADFRYYFSKLDFPLLPQNGHYHTAYESFGWMDKFVDQGFTHHLAIGRLWAGHALYLADSKILPYDLVLFTKQVKYYLDKFETRYKTMLANQSINLDFAKERLTALNDKATKFHEYVDKVKDTDDQNKLRSINDKLMNFERNFLMKGIGENVAIRHTIYATSTNTLWIEKFPGIGEAIARAYKGISSWDDVRKQITFVVWCFDTANRSLDVEEIKE